MSLPSPPTGDFCLVKVGNTRADREYWTGNSWSVCLSRALRYSSVEPIQNIVSRRFHRLHPPPIVRSIFDESTRR